MYFYSKTNQWFCLQNNKSKLKFYCKTNIILGDVNGYGMDYLIYKFLKMWYYSIFYSVSNQSSNFK